MSFGEITTESIGEWVGQPMKRTVFAVPKRHTHSLLMQVWLSGEPRSEEPELRNRLVSILRELRRHFRNVHAEDAFQVLMWGEPMREMEAR